MIMKKQIFIIPLIMLSLTSCGCSTTSSEVAVEIKDLKTCIQHLGTTNTFNLKLYSNDVLLNDYTYNKFYFCDNIQSSGYLLKNNKVYPYSIKDGKVTNGYVENDKTLYDNNAILPSFNDVQVDLIESSINSLKTLKRGIAEPLLLIAGFNDADYLSLNHVDISLSEQLDKLSIDYSLQGSDTDEIIYKAEISNFDTAKLDVIDDFIKNGEIIGENEDLLRIKSLFELDNYTQYQSDANNIPFQYDIFTKEYYAVLFTDAFISANPLAKAQQVGYLTINEPDRTLDILKSEDGTPIPLIYDDTYYFQYYGSYETQGLLNMITRENPKRPGHAQGGFIEQVLDIPAAFHYPKGLDLFKQLEKFYVDEEVDGLKSMTTENSYLIENFLNDYSLTDAFEKYGGVASLQIIYDLKSEDKDCKVAFRLNTAYGGYYQIDYINFNNTSFKPFEDFKTMYDID